MFSPWRNDTRLVWAIPDKTSRSDTEHLLAIGSELACPAENGGTILMKRRAILAAAMLLSLLASVAVFSDVPLEVANFSFEDWAPLAQVDPLWSLQDRSFPVGWTPESYKDVPSQARPASNQADDVARYGQRCLYLQGQIVSAKISRPLGTLVNRTVLVAVRARGAGGHLRVGLRGYSDPPDERLQYEAEVMKADTAEQWRTYSAVVFVSYGPGMREVTVELEGDGALIVKRLKDRPGRAPDPPEQKGEI